MCYVACYPKGSNESRPGAHDEPNQNDGIGKYYLIGLKEKNAKQVNPIEAHVIYITRKWRAMPFFGVELFHTAETEYVWAGAGQPAFFRATAATQLTFQESNVPDSLPASCSTGVSVGDTRLTTVGRLLYDFQAYGDFVLAQDGPDFVVLARQIPGPPAYPNTATNTAVAAKMGTNTIAVCMGPPRLMVNGKESNLAEGNSLSLAGGVQVRRQPGTYVIQDGTGDYVLANLIANRHGVWIDVQVGLSEAAQPSVTGLLANARGNPHALVTRTGTVLPEPVSFNDLYHTYANSWRVASDASGLTPITVLPRPMP
jgi:hypothetical protein